MVLIGGMQAARRTSKMCSMISRCVHNVGGVADMDLTFEALLGGLLPVACYSPVCLCRAGLFIS